MCCYSSEVVSTSDIFYVRFVFLFLFVFYVTHIVQTSFLIAVSVGVISCYIICYVSLHCFVGDRNSVGSVGSSRSTGSGQSSESFNPNPNKQNESHVRTDMCKVNAYTNILCILNAYTYKHLTLKSSWNDLTFNIRSGSKLHFFFHQMSPSAGESREQLHKMPEDDGKMADGTMGNPNFGNLCDTWLPCSYLIRCLRFLPRVWIKS